MTNLHPTATLGHREASVDREETPIVLPKSGDVLRVTRAASVQFIHPMLFRVIRVYDWPTYDGWAWLDGYQLNSAGDAVSRRSIFVQLSGLRYGHIGGVPAQPRPRTTVS